MPFDGTRPDEANLLLLRAADLIEERGHAKSALEDEKGRLCALGALNLAHSGNATNWSGARDFIKARNKLARQVKSNMISCWNNRPERTQQEVIDALRAATAQVI